MRLGLRLWIVLNLQNRVHLAHELHSDVNSAFGDGASELGDFVSFHIFDRVRILHMAQSIP